MSTQCCIAVKYNDSRLNLTCVKTQVFLESISFNCFPSMSKMSEKVVYVSFADEIALLTIKMKILFSMGHHYEVTYFPIDQVPSSKEFKDNNHLTICVCH